ncbi:MAG: hypothetical protein DRI57_00520 [Deltaproteobacteria bacterium]|nr:MAG: hypothetical protein DRI57_00520 [Deltaproteobacteria bacterium]
MRSANPLLLSRHGHLKIARQFIAGFRITHNLLSPAGWLNRPETFQSSLQDSGLRVIHPGNKLPGYSQQSPGINSRAESASRLKPAKQCASAYFGFYPGN